MRVFLCLISLSALALAKPQYNYGSGVSGSFGSSAGGENAIDIRGSFGGSHTGSSFTSGSSFGASNNGGNGGLSFTSGPSFGASNFNQHSSHSGISGSSVQSDGQFESTLVHKQFITVAAPEDHENLEHTKNLVIGRPQKNYRVVFIKAPSSSNANVKLSAQYAPKEEKTVIYVLAKNDNNLEVSDIATPAPEVPSKPEVFFIKYKTEEEAQHAQRQIQAEYDRIEGSSEHTDGGVAPQQSVIGILGDGHSGSGLSGSSSGLSSGSFVGSSSGLASKASGYLPPSA